MALNQNGSFGLDMESRLKGKSTVTDTHTVADTDTHTHTEAKETQTKRTYGTTWPSLHAKITAHAKANGTSYNDIVNKLLLEYAERNGL